MITETQAIAVYDVLVEECGAPDPNPSDRSFVRYMVADGFMKEWRFGGGLGFGGKCRINSNHSIPHVDYYHEDRTAARDAMAARANQRIRSLFGVTS